MPVGQTIKNGKLTFNDTSYNGVITNGVYKNGTGILTDGKFGLDDAKQEKGKGWVGWSSSLTESPYIDITFEFSGVRKFKDVTLTVNVNKKHSYAVFIGSQIFFASTNDDFSDTSFLQYYPRNFADSDAPYSKNITLRLCENTARFIKLRLYFGGRWLLITEISFNSGILACASFLRKFEGLRRFCVTKLATLDIVEVEKIKKSDVKKKTIQGSYIQGKFGCHRPLNQIS